MLGCPSRNIYYDLALTTWDHFKRSWFYFVAKMPYLPEILASAGDYGVFFEMWNKKFTGKFTENDLEAYKYVYSKTGLRFFIWSQNHLANLKCFVSLSYFLGAFTAAINYYRANSSFVCAQAGRKDDGTNGMFILGQRDSYISHAAFILMANEYPKLNVEVIPGANHFVHQDASIATNKLIRNFLGPISNYKVETLTWMWIPIFL